MRNGDTFSVSQMGFSAGIIIQIGIGVTQLQQQLPHAQKSPLVQV
jgi:hypothetical protein